jgi:dTDP-4-dehydrorhamnose 3,5-epimerase
LTVATTSIPGLLRVSFPEFSDSRGSFRQTYQARELDAQLGRPLRLRQGNHSRSIAGVLRGFHAEAWDKLVYVARGTAFVAIADVRPDSPTFGRHETFLMGDAPGEAIRLFVTQGLANAFYCQTEVDYINDVSEEFDPNRRGGVIWNDATLAVDWPSRDPILSDVDKALPTLRDLYPILPGRAGG